MREAGLGKDDQGQARIGQAWPAGSDDGRARARGEQLLKRGVVGGVLHMRPEHDTQRVGARHRRGEQVDRDPGAGPPVRRKRLTSAGWSRVR